MLLWTGAGLKGIGAERKRESNGGNEYVRCALPGIYRGIHCTSLNSKRCLVCAIPLYVYSMKQIFMEFPMSTHDPHLTYRMRRWDQPVHRCWHCGRDTTLCLLRPLCDDATHCHPINLLLRRDSVLPLDSEYERTKYGTKYVHRMN